MSLGSGKKSALIVRPRSEVFFVFAVGGSVIFFVVAGLVGGMLICYKNGCLG